MTIGKAPAIGGNMTRRGALVTLGGGAVTAGLLGSPFSALADTPANGAPPSHEHKACQANIETIRS